MHIHLHIDRQIRTLQRDGSPSGWVVRHVLGDGLVRGALHRVPASFQGCAAALHSAKGLWLRGLWFAFGGGLDGQLK